MRYELKRENISEKIKMNAFMPQLKVFSIFFSVYINRFNLKLWRKRISEITKEFF